MDESKKSKELFGIKLMYKVKYMSRILNSMSSNNDCIIIFSRKNVYSKRKIKNPVGHVFLNEQQKLILNNFSSIDHFTLFSLLIR